MGFMSSIAVSALVAPSRQLRIALGVYALVHLGAAVLVCAVVPERFGFSSLCAFFFLAAAMFLLHGCASLDKTHQIDVSGTGALRLTVQQKVGAGPVAATSLAVSLLPGSLLWPQLMLLRLADADGATYTVPVLRDSLAPTEYRSLRVALGNSHGPGTGTTTGAEIL